MNNNWVIRFVNALLFLSIGVEEYGLYAQNTLSNLKVDTIDVKQTEKSKLISIKPKALTELSPTKQEIAAPTFGHLDIKHTFIHEISMYQKPNLEFLLPNVSSGFWLNSNNSLLHSETKEIHFEYSILESLSITLGGDIGHTSLPLSAYPVIHYGAYLGAKYRFTDKLQAESRIYLAQV